MKTQTTPLNRLRAWTATLAVLAFLGFSTEAYAQSCSLPSIPTSQSIPYAGRSFNFSNVSLNNSGTTLSVSSGASVTITLNWSSTYQSSYCPGCGVQPYVGISNYWNTCLGSFYGYTSSGSLNYSFTAPTTPGIYYITVTGGLDHNCGSRNTPCSDNAIAAIKVGNPVNNAAVSISGNASVCNGGSTTLTANVSGTTCTGALTNYRWFLNGNVIAGSTASTYSATAYGNYTVEAYNCGGNAVTSSAFGFFGDNQGPVVTVQGYNADLGSNGTVSVALSDVFVSATDNCSLGTISVSKSSTTAGGQSVSFTCSETGNQTVYIHASDNNNNTTVKPATVVVRDAEDPTIRANDKVVYLNANGTASLTAADVDNNSYDNCGIASLTLTPSSFNCASIGQVSNGVLTGIVSADNEFQAYLSNSATSLGTQIGSGNNWATSTTIGNNTLQVGQDYYLHVKVTDWGMDEMLIAAFYATGSFEFENGTQTLYTGANHWTMAASLGGTPENIQELGSNGVSPWGYRTGIPSNAKHIWNYNYKTVGGETRYFTAKIKYIGGQTTVTLSGTDNNGNTSSDVATVQILDNIAPTVLTQNVSVTLNSNGTASITASQVNNGSYDNCSINSINVSPSNFNVNHIGNNTVTLTVTDAFGNISTGTAIVTVIDPAPVVVTQNATIYLDANGSANLAPSAIDNGSSAITGIASMSLSKTNFSCSDVGTQSVTLTVTSNTGNSASASANVTIVDNTAPTATAQNVTIYLDANGAASTTASAVNNGSSDNCGVASLSLSQTAFDCSHVGNNTVTLTVTDVNGNSSTANATVSVVDNINPSASAQNVTIYLDANGAASTTASAVNNGSSDNCGIASLSLSKTSFNCSNVGNNTVTLTVTDVNGNSSNTNATVTVVDNITPTASAQNVTIYLDANGAASTTASAVNNGSSDNCGVASLSLSKTSFDCSNVGNNTVTLTVTDVNGNSSNTNATVTVVDNVAPTASAQNVTIYLDANGSASTSASSVNNGSSDNCGVSSLSLSKTSFDCSNVGNNTVTLTVTDVNGNSSNTNATVTVVDNIAPTAIAQNVTIYLDANGAASTSAANVNNSSYDNCGIGSLSLSQTAFNCSHVGNNTVTLTVTDVNGNSSSKNATITVVDNIAPTVLTQNITVTLANGAASITAADVNNGSYDNCSIASMSVSPNSFTCNDIGNNTVTLTVTDVNGNTASSNATVNVDGVIPSCSLTSAPSNNTYTGAAVNQMFIGYGPQSMNLTCAATGGSSFSYSWSGSNLSNSTGSTNVFTPTAGGNYTITCTVTNNNGCVTTCNITICVLDIRSNNNPNNQKVYLCHVPNGNNNNPQTLSISVNAVPSHLNNHGGDRLGQCSQSCNQLKNEPVGELYELGEEVDLIVYPNPSSGLFKFTLESSSDENISIQLFDAAGKMVKEVKGGHAFEEMHVDITSMAPGVYSAVVRQGEITKTVKLTKTN
ncbi:MAG: T9SS type A sorting domain-containing protein [Bacteroidetes bacterium]|nr:MAG: T9SS type A sorting domain-containing protein [Bacteroidota bacterium]